LPRGFKRSRIMASWRGAWMMRGMAIAVAATLALARIEVSAASVTYHLVPASGRLSDGYAEVVFASPPASPTIPWSIPTFDFVDILSVTVFNVPGVESHTLPLLFPESTFP